MSSDLLEIRLEEFLLDLVIVDDLVPVEPASASDVVDDIEQNAFRDIGWRILATIVVLVQQ